jgi:hypothetical protein
MRISSNSGPCGRTQGAAGNPPRWPGPGGSRKGNNNNNLNICILNFTTSRKIVLPESAKIKAILFLFNQVRSPKVRKAIPLDVEAPQPKHSMKQMTNKQLVVKT